MTLYNITVKVKHPFLHSLNSKYHMLIPRFTHWIPNTLSPNNQYYSHKILDNPTEHPTRSRIRVHLCIDMSPSSNSSTAKRCIQFWALPRFSCTCTNPKSSITHSYQAISPESYRIVVPTFLQVWFKQTTQQLQQFYKMHQTP